MSDEHQVPPGSDDSRGAVARLAEALASAQAVARDDALGPDPSEPDASEPDASEPDASEPDASEPDASEPDASESDASEPHESTDELPVVGPSAVGHASSDEPDSDQERQTARRKPRRLWPLYAVMAVLVIAVPVLIGVGYRIASDSTAGEVLSGRNKPDAPGYTALVEPTPVALVMQVSDDGEARGLTILSLSGPNQRGGAVIATPLDIRFDKPRFGVRTFPGVIKINRTKTAGTAIGSTLGLGFTDTIKLTDSDLATLLEPVSPLKIDNPEPVTTPDGDTIDAGPVELAGSEVSDYLAADDAGDTMSGRLARQQLVWKAWIDKIGQIGPARAIPGETDVGLGHYLSQLAAGDVQSTTFPVRPAPDIDGEPTVKVAHDPAMLLIANAVPFPIAAVPGERATVALLSGTGPESVPPAVIQRLTFSGAQITTVGNATRFDHAVTTLTYSVPGARSFAEDMARELGVGRVVHRTSSDTGVDVSVVLGRDLMSDPPDPLTAEEVRTDR